MPALPIRRPRVEHGVQQRPGKGLRLLWVAV
jgi:hypothetical protein